MVKIKYSSLVSGMSGSLNGSTFARNASGSYIRNKVSPVNPQTAAQQQERGNFSQITQAWRGLSDAQRSDWNSIASEYEKSDVFGDNLKPSGFNLFTRLNRYRLIMGEPILESPLLPKSVPSLASAELTAEDTPTLELAITPDPAPENVKIAVWATPTVSAGRSFVRDQLRMIQVEDAQTTSPIDLLSSWQDRFGEDLELDGKIIVRAQPIRVETGQPGAIIQAEDIVTTV